MNWLNLKVSIVRAAEYAGSEPVQRATWLNVLIYCSEHENGGRIVGARKWTDRLWQHACGVTQSEVDSASSLLTWDGDDLLVWSYPVEREAEVKAKREGGKAGGIRSGASRREGKLEGEQEPDPEASLKQSRSSASSLASRTPRTEEEGKGTGIGTGKESPLPPSAAGSGATASPPLGGGEGSGSKKNDNLPTSEPAKRLSLLFRRRITTAWGEKELKAYKKIAKRDILTDENLTLLEGYYAAERARGDAGNHRRDLCTFLNNFNGELDRATAWAENPNPAPRTNGTHAPARPPMPQPGEHF